MDKKDADVDRLTNGDGTWPEQEIVSAWLKKYAISVPFSQQLELQETLTKLRQSLSQEAVREEVLEEVAQMAQDRAASEHDDFSEFAHDVRALKREPNAAAQAGQGFSSAPSHEGHAAGPAPAAPDVASMVKRLLECEHDTTCELHQKNGYTVIRSCDCTLSVRKEAAALLEALAGVDSGGRAQLLR